MQWLWILKSFIKVSYRTNWFKNWFVTLLSSDLMIFEFHYQYIIRKMIWFKVVIEIKLMMLRFSCHWGSGQSGSCIALLVSASLPPPSCQKQGKWKHRKKNPDRLCTIHNNSVSYHAGCEEKIAVDEVVFWSTIPATPYLFTYMWCNSNG